MPLPLILGIGAAIAGTVGVGSAIKGGKEMKDAKETSEYAQRMVNRNNEKFKNQSDITNKEMDELGKYELEILKSFDKFAELIEKIQNRPDFKEIEKNGIKVPEYDPEKLKEVSVGAGVLLGGLGGAALGTAGGFAAAGATTAAVMALGTASTGTAIASLSGAAATNAALAALGGGAIAAGGGGMALGTAVLGAATLGIGLLIGGAIFNITGSKLSEKADEAMSEARKHESKVNEVCKYLKEVQETAHNYLYNGLKIVNEKYISKLETLYNIIEIKKKTNWNDFTNSEKELTKSVILLVSLLYEMCKVQLIIKSEDDQEMNKINYTGINKGIDDANKACA